MTKLDEKLSSPDNIQVNEKKQLSLEDIIKPGDNLEDLAQDKKFLEQLAERKYKLVEVGLLSEGLKNEILQIVDSLMKLRNLIVEKGQEVLTKNSSIKEKIEKLTAHGDVKINQQEYKKSEISVLHYMHLLKNISLETDKEMAYFAQFLKEDHPKLIIAKTTESDNFEKLVQSKISLAKRYVKTISKDVQVSYSRYCYGFDAQLKRIIYIEALVPQVKK